MEAARVPRVDSGPSERTLVATLLALAIVAWLVTSDRMTGMDAGPATDPGSLGFHIGVWVVMMAAMMFPSIAPMAVGYARGPGRRRGGGAVRCRVSVLATGVAFVPGSVPGLTVPDASADHDSMMQMK